MPSPFRYTTPVPAGAATGRVAEVYAQLAEDFGYARPTLFMALSPAPDVLAAAWSLVRESLLAEGASRTGRRIVGAGVSLANRCPFCLTAHTVLLHAEGDHRLAETVAAGGTPSDPAQARLLAWAKATRTPGAAELSGPPPFPAGEAAPLYLGTALAFHFVNRMVSTLTTEEVLPGGLERLRPVRSLGGRTIARAARRSLPAGRSLPLLSGLSAGPEPGWADGSPVGRAYAVLCRAAAGGAARLGERSRAAVAGAVAGWDGAHPPLGGDWLSGPLDGVPAAERPAVRLALLAAMAPYRITDADVAAWRTADPDPFDSDLVRLLAYGAITATERVAAGLCSGVRNGVRNGVRSGA